MSDRAKTQSAEPYVGCRVRKLNGNVFVTYRARFVATLARLVLVVLRSPHAHTGNQGIETRRQRAGLAGS